MTMKKTTTKQQYEVTFWGAPEGISYRRWHRDLAQAMETARAVLAQMSNRSAHPAIIYGPGLGRDGVSIP